MNNDAPQTLDAAGSRVAELEQQLRLSDEGVSRLAQRCLELEQQVLKYEAVLASQGADTEQGALLLPQLFYDSGSGFSPHECLTVAPDSYDELTHEVSAVFELPVEARALRLDPGEFACCITDFSLSDERLSYHILNGNALQEGTMLFMNIDPNLTVESAVGFPAGLRFAVKYRYYPLGRYLHEQPGKALLRALTVLKEETEAVSRQGTEQLLEANAEIQQLRKQLAEQQQHLADLQNSRAAYEASLENVLGSSSWKLTAPRLKRAHLRYEYERTLLSSPCSAASCGNRPIPTPRAPICWCTPRAAATPWPFLWPSSCTASSGWWTGWKVS